MGVDNEKVENRVMELRKELRISEEEFESLQMSVERTRKQAEQEDAKHQTKLDNARNQLQRSLSDAAAAHNKEVAKLEDEIMAERHQVEIDMLAEKSCVDQIAQLEQTRSQLLADRVSISTQVQTDIGRCVALKEELSHVRV